MFLAEDRLDGKLVALKSVLSSNRRPLARTDAADPPPRLDEGALTATMAPPQAEATAGSDNWLAPTFTAQQLPAPTPPHHASDSSALELRLALTREFATLASLRHPYIVSVLDYGFEGGSPFFTMEYLPESRDLFQVAQASSLRDKVVLLAQIAQALAYLHRRGILHRDLKPANVLIIDVAAERQVKVLDFGLALPRDLSAGTAGLSGTLAYMAPELFTGSPPSEASDLYALGIIAFEMLANDRHPIAQFERAGVRELIAAIQSLQADTSTLDAPEALRGVVSRLLSKDATERRRSACERALPSSGPCAPGRAALDSRELLASGAVCLTPGGNAGRTRWAAERDAGARGADPNRWGERRGQVATPRRSANAGAGAWCAGAAWPSGARGRRRISGSARCRRAAQSERADRGSSAGCPHAAVPALVWAAQSIRRRCARARCPEHAGADARGAGAAVRGRFERSAAHASDSPGRSALGRKREPVSARPSGSIYRAQRIAGARDLPRR